MSRLALLTFHGDSFDALLGAVLILYDEEVVAEVTRLHRPEVEVDDLLRGPATNLPAHTPNTTLRD